MERKAAKTHVEKIKANVQLVIEGRSTTNVVNELDIKFINLRRYVEKIRNIYSIADIEFCSKLRISSGGPGRIMVNELILLSIMSSESNIH